MIRYKWQHVVCILGLTIGLTAFILGAYWRYWEHHFDDFHPGARHVNGITTTGIARAADGTPAELDRLPAADVKWMLENIPEIDKYCSVEWVHLKYTQDRKDEHIMGFIVDSAFFSMFYSEFIDGSYKQAPYNGSHIVLTERAAIKYFGKTDCTGEIFPAENKKVAGVIRDYPANSAFHGCISNCRFTTFPSLRDNLLSKQSSVSVVYWIASFLAMTGCDNLKCTRYGLST